MGYVSQDSSMRDSSQGTKPHRPLRVLMIAPTSFFADYGCHVRILGQARGLTKAGHQVMLCTYHTGRDVPDLHIRRTKALPWRRSVEIGSSWHRLILDGFLLCTVFRSARQFRPHVLHAFLHEGALIATIVGRMLSIPVIFDFQGSMTGEMIDHHFMKPSSPMLGFLRRLERWINHQPAALLANSHHAAGLLTEEFGVPARRVHVVRDSVDIRRFVPPDAAVIRHVEALRSKLGIETNACVVVYLGLLAPYQGIDLLLQSLRYLNNGQKIHLLMMGFPDVERYQRLAESLDVARRVTFTGAIPFEDAHHLLALGDIAVGPKLSATEGNGKLLGYMAMGLPVVAFDTPVSREYLGEGGMYVPPGSVAGLSGAIRSLAGDAEQRAGLGRRLRQRAVDHFRWPESIGLIESVYADLCSEA